MSATRIDGPRAVVHYRAAGKDIMHRSASIVDKGIRVTTDVEKVTCYHCLWWIMRKADSQMKKVDEARRLK